MWLHWLGIRLPRDQTSWVLVPFLPGGGLRQPLHSQTQATWAWGQVLSVEKGNTYKAMMAP